MAILTELPAQTTGTYVAYVIEADGYLYVGNGDLAVKVYDFNGTIFTQLATYIVPGNVNSIWVQNDTVFVGDMVGETVVLHFDGTSLTQIVLNNTFSDGLRDIWGDGTYIYAAAGAAGMIAYSFNGNDLNEIDRYSPPGTNTRAIWGDGNYIYVSDYGTQTISAHTFDGTNLVEVGSVGFIGPLDVAVSGQFIFSAQFNDGLVVYKFDGSNFVQMDGDFSIDCTVSVSTSGEYIFVTDQTQGLIVYLFNGTTLERLATIAMDTFALDNNPRLVGWGLCLPCRWCLWRPRL
jgi:hypothetical protein